MSPSVHATLWALSLLTVVYVSRSYVEAQRIRALQHTEHSIPKDPVYRVSQVGGQVMRVNETTGETSYWSPDGGGWVTVKETNLVSAVSTDERAARTAVLQTWYAAMGSEATTDYATFEAGLIDVPAWELKDYFAKWKSGKDAEANQQRRVQEATEFAKRETLIAAWYDTLDEAYKKDVSYEAYKANLINAPDFEERKTVIKTWYELMDDEYRRRVPFERFEALGINYPLAQLQAALREKRPNSPLVKQAPPGDTEPVERGIASRFAPGSVFCPMGGEVYESTVKFCPNHGVKTRLLQ